MERVKLEFVTSGGDGQEILDTAAEAVKDNFTDAILVQGEIEEVEVVPKRN